MMELQRWPLEGVVERRGLVSNAKIAHESKLN